MTDNAIAVPDLASVDSFADAFAMLKAAGLNPHVVNPFTLIEDKDSLLGIPFLILSYKFNPGSYGEEPFVSVSAITEKNDKIVFNDGSTGIRAQLQALEERGIHSAIVCTSGLRKSAYFFNEKTGEVSNTGGKDFAPASTYYLD